MSQELYYTSAPQGLRPGSRGFCTVVSTHGMSLPLADRLESLSGYRPVFPPHDPKAAENPVVHSHLRIHVGGKKYHVLSRIGFAGLDYTQRSNKFAHHVVPTEDELPAAGPAWLLGQPGFMESEWDGNARILPAGRTPPSGDLAPGVCRGWEQTTGDAGWAGVLAEAFLAEASRPTFLVFEPGMEMLPLLVEAQSLLPVEQRWDVSFSTYFTHLPQGVSCAWRCVLRDSAEAKQARRFPNALILNLCEPMGAAEGSEWVGQARTGTLSLPRIFPQADQPDLEPSDRHPESIHATAVGKLPQSRLMPIPPVPIGPERKTRRSGRRFAPRAGFSRRRRWVLITSCVAALFLLISTTTAFTLWLRVGTPVSDSSAKDTAVSSTSNNISDRSYFGVSQNDSAPLESNNSERASNAETNSSVVRSDQNPEHNKGSAENRSKGVRYGAVVVDNSERGSHESGQDKNDLTEAEQSHARHGNHNLEIPDAYISLPNLPVGEFAGSEIFSDFFPSSGSYALKLRGLAAEIHPKESLPSPLAVSWKPTRDATKTLESDVALAIVSITDDKLTFRWISGRSVDRREDQRRLRNCVLEICGDNGTRTLVALRRPLERDPLRIEMVEPLVWSEHDGSPSGTLFLEKPQVTIPGFRTRLDDNATEEGRRYIFNVKPKNPRVDLVVRLDPDTRSLIVELNPSPEELARDYSNKMAELEAKENELEDLMQEKGKQTASPPDPKEKKRRDDRKRKLNNEIPNLKTLVSTMKTLVKDKIPRTRAEGRVSVSVYMIVDDSVRVDVVRCGAKHQTQ